MLGTTSGHDGRITTAMEAGATPDEIVGVLVAPAPTVGIARIVATAPEIAIALGYEDGEET